MAAGWSNLGVPDNCLIRDERGAGGSFGTGYYKGIDFYGRYTNVAPGLNIIQPLMVEGDAYAGGINTGTAKTQYSGFHSEFDARTVGERKNVVGFMRCQGKGDCLGSAFWAQDWGGYAGGGDEGNEGGRFEADQADGAAYPVPSGTVSSVNGNAVTVSWSGGSNAYVGEARPLINLSRGVYATGTVAGTALTNGACTVTGSGTAWATTFGAGAHQDLFLEIVANDGTHLRWTVPVLQVVDDTHLVIEYTLVELGPTCLGSWMTSSGTYKVYRGGVVASLGAVTTGTKLPAGVNLAAGGAFFEAGDNIEEPVGYNYHGTGIAVLVSREVGEPQGSGVYVGNLGAAPFQNLLKSNGPFLNGLMLDSPLVQDGLVFNQPVGGGFGALVRSNDQLSANTRLMLWKSANGGLRSVDYDRTGDVLSLPGGQYFSASSAQFGIGTTPVPGTLAYLYDGVANQTGLTVAATGASGDAPLIMTTNASGIAAFKSNPLTTEFNGGMNLVGYSGNEINPTWRVNSADGSASFGTTTLGTTTLGATTAE
jgi:hypothetical protein